MILSNIFMTDVRVYKEAKALVDAGHEVTVIVWDRKHQYKPEDVVDGIKVVRLHNNLLMKALRKDLFRNPIWWGRAYRKGLGLYKNGFNFDVVHCHDLDTLKAGVKLKKKTGCKLVYDAHEVFGHMIEGAVKEFVLNFVFRMEKKLIKHADHVITVTEKLKKEYFEEIANAPITVVMNCKDLISKEYKPPNNDVFTVTFISTLHKRRLFPELIDAIGEIPNSRFIIAAKKENMDLYREVEKLSTKYENVTFLGQIPFDQVISRTLNSNVIIDPIDPTTETEKLGIGNNKLFEAMACGRPIICTKRTYSGKIAEESQCGLNADYDVNSFKEAVTKLRDDPTLCEKLGKNALNASMTKYNWENEKEKLLKVYKELFNGEDKKLVRK